PLELWAPGFCETPIAAVKLERSRNELERPSFSEADEPATRYDHVVQKVHPEELRAVLQALGQSAILRAGLRVARRMIVHDHERRCTRSYRGSEDFPGADQTGRQGSHGHRVPPDHAMPSVEIEA